MFYVRSERTVLHVTVFHAGWNVVDSGAVFAVSGPRGLLAPATSAAVVWAAAIGVVVADRETVR